MAYALTYRMDFVDRFLMQFRVDFLLKDGTELTAPILITEPDVEPLVIEYKNSGENRFSPIITSEVTINYYYTGEGNIPTPETFINIEEDTWLVNIYRQGVLYWKGFVRPDGGSYPWLYPPYTFSLKAVDFTFCKGTRMDLDGNDDLLLYDFITVGDFFGRSLFQAIGYDDPILNILFETKPAVIGSDPVTALNVHTDAFYDLEDGVNYVYDALEKLCESLGTRLFYSAGRYWLQRIQEVYNDSQSLCVIDPTNLTGDIVANNDVYKILGSSPSADIRYYNRTQILKIDPALKQQDFNYKLKSINRVQNFDWREGNGLSPFPDWEGDVSGDGTLQRIGTGSAEDPYKLRVNQWDFPNARQIWSRIPVTPGQVFEINAKAIGHNAKYLEIIVYLVETGGLTDTDSRRLDDGGTWSDASGNSSDALRISVENNSDNGTLNVISDRIPEIPAYSGIDLLLEISRPIPIDIVPPGEDVYVDLYPIFGRLFINNYSDIETRIINDKVFSLIPEGKELFFLDTVDERLSNTLYYDNGSSIVPIPDDNWPTDETIDELVARTYLDQQAAPSYTFQGDVLTNELDFHHYIRLEDKDNMKMMQVRDSYKVRSAVHSLVAAELKQLGSGDGTYTVTPITRQQ